MNFLTRFGKLTACTALLTAASALAAHATATATGNEYDGIVDLQNFAQGILDNGGAMAIMIISVILGGAFYTFKRDVMALMAPLIVGIFFSVGLNIATSFAGATAGTTQYVVEMTSQK